MLAAALPLDVRFHVNFPLLSLPLQIGWNRLGHLPFVDQTKGPFIGADIENGEYQPQLLTASSRYTLYPSVLEDSA